MEKYQQLWNSVLDKLSVNYGYETYTEIFADCKDIYKVDNGVIYIIVPSLYIKTKINNFYLQRIIETSNTLTSDYVRYKFVTASEVVPTELPKPKKAEVTFESNLNGNYTFESFVVGQSNMMSYRMAMKVASQPGQVANPLYIFGGVGLGKTHLMEAIGNYMLDEDLTRKILYVPANTFIEDYSKSTMRGDFTAFEKKYKSLDVLLVDDIQMLKIGEKSQHEFFNLFNDLFQKKKQIVITSDCPAQKLVGIMDRLTSRFSWGLSVDIKAPDQEHRVNILKRKIQESSEKTVPNNVLEYIADNFTDNIRELEGGFNRVLFYCVAFDCEITLENAKESLEPLLKNKNTEGNQNTYESLLSVIAAFYDITLADIYSKKRSRKFVLPRQIGMYLLKEKYNLSYKKIGGLLSRDHTTIISGYQKINEELKTNKELKMAISALERKVSD